MIRAYRVSVLIIGLAFILKNGPTFWIRLTMGVFLIGSFVRIVAVDRCWSRVREGMHLSELAGLQAAWTLFVGTGIAFAIVGFVYRGPRVGAIVAFFRSGLDVGVVSAATVPHESRAPERMRRLFARHFLQS